MNINQKNYKVLTIFFILIVCTLLDVNATSLTLMVSQKDGASTLLRKTTQIVEDSLLEFFFDSGIVVSNEPISTKGKEKQIKKKIYETASQGNCDYVLALTINYKKNTSKSSEKILLDDIVNIGWEVVDTLTDDVLFRGEKVPQVNHIAVKNSLEVINAVNDFTCELGKEIIDGLSLHKYRKER
ncbi:MAG: hypothetical protein ACRC4W_02665 [Treponemataceae bacterium]